MARRRVKVSSSKDLGKVDRMFGNVERASNAKQVAPDVEDVRPVAQKILERAQELVPYDTGELHDSGEVVEERTSGGGTRLSIQFTAPHAARQHEDLSLSHPEFGPNKRNPALWAPAPAGQRGQAKFLHTAMMEYIDEFAKVARTGSRTKINSRLGGARGRR